MFAWQTHASATLARKVGYCLLPALLGMGAALALLFVASGPAGRAYAGTLTFPGACGASIQACIDGASPGDTILITAGDYTESLTLSKAVSLTGALSSTTILHALPNTRVLTVTGAAVDSSVVISGLTFAGGHALGGSCPAGCGGAILINANAQPLLVNLTISNSLADLDGGGLYADTGSPLVMSGAAVLSNTSTGGGGGAYAQGNVTLDGALFRDNRCTGEGGGLYASFGLATTNTQFLSNTCGGGGGAFASGTATINGGIFQNNQCTESGCGGGGLIVGGNLVVTNTQFLSNTSFEIGGGAFATLSATIYGGVFQNNKCTDISISNTCYGGGLFVNNDLNLSGTQFLSNTSTGRGGGASASGLVTLNGGLFQNNQCIGSGCSGVGQGGGGGLFAGTLIMTGTQFLNNSGVNSGGGVYAADGATLSGGVFQNNQCTAANCQGGGLFAYSDLVLTDTQFLSNTCGHDGSGGGAYVGGNATLDAGIFQNNQCGGFAAVGGGGLYAGGNLTATNTHFLSNTIIGPGGGAFVSGDAILNGSAFQNNIGWVGGGLFAGGSTTVNGGLFQNNSSGGGGGGLSAANLAANLTVTDTQFLSNTSSGGGAAFINPVNGRIVNSLFAGNSASQGGAALYLGAFSGSLAIVDTTIASPTLGSGAAILVYTGTVGITNTIIASYTTGISQMAGSVFQDYNLFFGNGTNTAGTVSGGAHSLIGDPAFVNPSGDDYHLGSGSLAIDAGTNAGVTTDVDGDPRPQGNGFDIGFDESPYTALANVGVTKSASTRLLAPGQLLTYTLVYSNAGPYVATGVLLTDIVPANLIAVTYTTSGAALTPVGLNHYTWQVASLPSGQGGIITLTGILSGDLHGTIFTNTAVITSIYSDTDPANNSSAVSVIVANVAPVAAGDAYTLAPNGTLTITAPGVLANDSDVNNDPLTALPPNPPVTGLVLAPTGALTYTPPIGFSGLVTFTYRASDGLLLSPPTTVTITFNAFKLYLPLLMR